MASKVGLYRYILGLEKDVQKLNKMMSLFLELGYTGYCPIGSGLSATLNWYYNEIDKQKQLHKECGENVR